MKALLFITLICNHFFFNILYKCLLILLHYEVSFTNKYYYFLYLFYFIFFFKKNKKVINIVWTTSSYLNGLSRSFDEAENKIVDLFVSMPSSEVNNLVKITQISTNQVQMGAGNIKDFKYLNTTIIIKWDGYVIKFLLIILLYSINFFYLIFCLIILKL